MTRDGKTEKAGETGALPPQWTYKLPPQETHRPPPGITTFWEREFCGNCVEVADTASSEAVARVPQELYDSEKATRLQGTSDRDNSAAPEEPGNVQPETVRSDPRNTNCRSDEVSMPEASQPFSSPVPARDAEEFERDADFKASGMDVVRSSEDRVCDEKRKDADTEKGRSATSAVEEFFRRLNAIYGSPPVFCEDDALYEDVPNKETTALEQETSAAEVIASDVPLHPVNEEHTTQLESTLSAEESAVMAVVEYDDLWESEADYEWACEQEYKRDLHCQKTGLAYPMPVFDVPVEKIAEDFRQRMLETEDKSHYAISSCPFPSFFNPVDPHRDTETDPLSPPSPPYVLYLKTRRV